MNRRLMVLLILLLVLICGTAPDARSESKTANIALVIALSGVAAEDNAPAVNSARLALEEINRQGGLAGRPAALILMDNQSTPLGSKIAAQKAAASSAVAVIGAIWSSHSLPMARILQSSGVPMITPTSSNPKVTRVGDYIFRACFNDEFQGEVIANVACEDVGAKTAAILRNANEEYSMTLAARFSSSFERMGGKVLFSGTYKGEAADFTECLQGIKEKSPDVVFIPGYGRDSGLAVKQARNMGIDAVFLGGDGWDGEIREYGGEALVGSMYSTHWHPDVSFPASRHLLRLYRKAYKGERVGNTSIPLTYDAIMLLADAVKRAESLDRKAVRDALAATRGFEGATGTITFDAQGDPVRKEACIVRMDRESDRLLRTVSP